MTATIPAPALQCEAALSDAILQAARAALLKNPGQWVTLPAGAKNEPLVPLLLGLSLRRLFPASISRLLGPLDRFANILLLLLVLAVLIRTAPLLVQFGAANLAGVLLMAVLVLLSLAVGFLLAGDGRERRITASLVTSMRNPGLALLLAARFAPELPTVKLGILVYVLVTVLVSIPVLRRSRTVGVMR